MNFKSKFQLLLIFLFAAISLACLCPLKKLTTLQREAIENAECIFIGQITEIDLTNYSFTIKVVESLDGGDAINNLYEVKQFYSCDIFTDIKENWIVYGNSEGRYLTMSECGLSRPIERPFAGLSTPPPAPIANSYEKEKSEFFEKQWNDDLLKAKTDLQQEIQVLRIRRDSLASI